jgi:hypothetical protein
MALFRRRLFFDRGLKAENGMGAYLIATGSNGTSATAVPAHLGFRQEDLTDLRQAA